MMRRALFLLFFAAGFARAAKPDDAVEAHGVRVSFEGVDKTMRTDVVEIIEQQLALSDDEKSAAPLADDLAFFVQQAYRQSGREDAHVTWEITEGTTILHVEGGTVLSIGVISYEGNSSQKEEDLTKYLQRPTQERFGKNKVTPFVINDLQQGAILVQRFFESQGYLDAKVDEPVAKPGSAENTRDIIVRITEGRRYAFGEARVDGDLLDEEKSVQMLLEDLKGQPFSEVKAESVRAQLANLFQRKGYFSAKVTVEAESAKHSDGTVPAVFHVEPGKQYRVTAVEVADDFSKGAQRLVKSSFNAAMNRLYKPGDIEIMHRHTLDTEVFSRLNVEAVPGADETMTLKLSGEEGPRKRLSLYAGYETFQGPIVGFEARHLNIFNTGDAFQLKAELNGIGWKGSVRWIDPAVFNTPNLFDLDLSTESVSFFGVQELKAGLRGTVRRQWNTHVTTSAYAELSHHSISEDLLLPDELGPTSYNLALGGLSAVFDYRNNPLITTKGWMAGGSAEIGTALLGGTVSYLKTEIFLSYYQPFTKKLRGSFNAHTRAIQSSGGLQKLPLDLRLLNGGGTTVRSFPEQELELSLEHFGGSLTQTFNVELSYEIISNLELAAFMDAGNVRRDSANPIASPTDLRYAAGLGIRYKLPFGPLRVDYGYNLDRKQGEGTGALHITFGFPF